MTKEVTIADLSPEQRRFLLGADQAGAIAFRIRREPSISALFDYGLIDAELIDSDHALLFLTKAGRTAAARLRDNMG